MCKNIWTLLDVVLKNTNGAYFSNNFFLVSCNFNNTNQETSLKKGIKYFLFLFHSSFEMVARELHYHFIYSSVHRNSYVCMY